MATITEVLDELAGMSGLEASELSHQEPGWQLTEIGETIPYAAAFLGYPQISTPVSQALERAAIERHGLVING